MMDWVRKQHGINKMHVPQTPLSPLQPRLPKIVPVAEPNTTDLLLDDITLYRSTNSVQGRR